MKQMTLAVLLVFTLAACGGSSDESVDDAASTGTPTTSDESEVRACDDLWVAGATLPEDYEGCMRADDSLEAAVIQDCEDPAGEWTGYDDRFYALLGGEIKAIEGDSDQAYSDFYDRCAGV